MSHFATLLDLYRASVWPLVALIFGLVFLEERRRYTFMVAGASFARCPR